MPTIYPAELKVKTIRRYEKGESIKVLSQEMHISQSTLYQRTAKSFNLLQRPGKTVYYFQKTCWTIAEIQCKTIFLRDGKITGSRRCWILFLPIQTGEGLLKRLHFLAAFSQEREEAYLALQWGASPPDAKRHHGRLRMRTSHFIGKQCLSFAEEY